ncbi:hypothetical protein JCM13664_04530 [Methylothermus subterraneus]
MSRLTAFKVPNDVVFFAVWLPFALAFLEWPPQIFWRGVLAAAAYTIGLALAVVYQSRVAVLTALTGSAVFFALQRQAKRSLAAMVLVACGVVLVDAAFGFKLIGKLQASWTSRLPLWLAAWRMFLASPWIGHGIGSFALRSPYDLDPASLPAWIAFDPRGIPWAHNLYLEMLAELGVLGLSALLFLMAFPLGKQPKHPPTSQIERFARAAGTALFAFALSAFFELSLWRQWVGLAFFLTIGCLTATNKTQEGAP